MRHPLETNGVRQPRLPISRILACSLIGSVLFCGCSPAASPAQATGEVRLTGIPIEEGTIRFFQINGTPGRGAASHIQNGRYTVRPEQGLFAGTYQVSIQGWRRTGRASKAIDDRTPGLEGVAQASQEPIYETTEVVPEEYNVRSKLVVTLKPGDNRVDLPLEAPH